MKLLVSARVRKRSRPHLLVRHTVKVEIGRRAPANRSQSLGPGECRIKRPEVIFRPGWKTIIQIMHAILSAGSALPLDGIAVLEMADLVGEGNVL